MEGSYLYDSKFFVSKKGKADKKVFEYKVYGLRTEGNGKKQKEKFLGQVSFDLGNYMTKLGEIVELGLLKSPFKQSTIQFKIWICDKDDMVQNVS